MYRFACMILITMMPNYALSQDGSEKLKSQSTMIAHHLEGMLGATALLLDKVSDEVSSERYTGDVMHSALNQYASILDEVRAILVIDESGFLKWDSTRKSFERLNLSSRSYFSRTIYTDEVTISKPIHGKQSGVPFIPISKRITTPLRQSKGVAVAVTTPQSWLDGIRACSLCVITIFDGDGNLLVANPPDTEVLSILYDGIDKTKHEGSFASKLGSYPAITFWHKVSGYDVFVTSSAILPNG
ncbi:PDC sensor domain-containing protein [Kiloniella majae]|uniref:PDC sensor domain-containing protein n=1 Tax=Kiloniella majae TaxID=1938558 RepID=UPI000A278D51|nr:hypothetical protein [Kiloniella majae]